MGLVARSADKLKAVAEEITAAGGNAEVLPCDVSQPEAIEQVIADVMGKHERLDILVNDIGGEDQAEWAVDVYPKGVWFQRGVAVYSHLGISGLEVEI